HPLKREGWVKVANDLRGEVVDPDADREATPAYIEQARAFLAERIPGLADARLAGSRACLYENTPDHDFVVDWVPGSQRILVAGARERQDQVGAALDGRTGAQQRADRHLADDVPGVARADDPQARRLAGGGALGDREVAQGVEVVGLVAGRNARDGREVAPQV